VGVAVARRTHLDAVAALCDASWKLIALAMTLSMRKSQLRSL